MHLLDANVELGNLVKLVHVQSCLYALGHAPPKPSAIEPVCTVDSGMSGRYSRVP
jgi:hypothetical protein